jgi:hypothetical protein
LGQISIEMNCQSKNSQFKRMILTGSAELPSCQLRPGEAASGSVFRMLDSRTIAGLLAASGSAGRTRILDPQTACLSVKLL